MKKQLLEKLVKLIETPGNVLEIQTQPDGSALVIEVARRPEHGRADVVRQDDGQIIILYEPTIQ